jgi:hypothetical protein
MDPDRMSLGAAKLGPALGKVAARPHLGYRWQILETGPAQGGCHLELPSDPLE